MRGYSATINMKAKLLNFGGTTAFMLLAVFAMLALSLPAFAQYRTATGSYERDHCRTAPSHPLAQLRRHGRACTGF